MIDKIKVKQDSLTILIVDNNKNVKKVDTGAKNTKYKWSLK